MAPLAEDAFGTDETATAGDLYAALHLITFGVPAGTEEEAVANFAEYGLVPDGVDAATQLTNGMSDQLFVIFGAAVGLPLEADAPNEKTDLPMTRGELAEQIMLLCSFIQ